MDKQFFKIIDKEIPVYDSISAYEPIKNMIETASYAVCEFKKQSSINIVDIISTFDIETTVVKNDNSEKQSGKYSHFNYCFCWQACFMDLEGNYIFVFGRYVKEYFVLIEKLKEYLVNIGAGLRVYVHNLAYEYNNLCEYFIDFCGENIFMRDRIHPLSIGDKYLEFRCSYQLTHKSLSTLSKEVGLVKGGDFDYNVSRHSETPLTDNELEYCFRDVYNLAVWLKTETINYGKEFVNNRYNNNQDDSPHVMYLPLTMTGYVRTSVRKEYSNKKGKMRPYQYQLSHDNYLYMRRAFRGGDTHANFRNVGTIYTDIRHRDFTSAYPGVMILEKFPAYNFEKLELDLYDNEHNKQLLNRKIENGRAVISTILFKNIRVKPTATPYIPKSKVEYGYKYGDIIITDTSLKNINNEYPMIIDNGRVLQAPLLKITVCEVDLSIIADCYDYDDYVVEYAIHSSKDYLPNDLRKIILQYFQNKTQYKNISGKEYLYALSKNMLNAIYGLSATALEHEQWFINDCLETDYNEIDFKNSTVMPYAWAIYITAYVRRNLNYFKKLLGNKYIYCDTDSIFYEKDASFELEVEKYNTMIRTKLNNLIPVFGEDLVTPKNPKGIRQYLGVFMADDDYIIDKFITIGAKRYIYEQNVNGVKTLNLTFAGLTDTKGHFTNNRKWVNGANVDYIINHYKMYGDIFAIFRKIMYSNTFEIKVPYRKDNYITKDDEGNDCEKYGEIGKLCNYVERGEFEGYIDDGITVKKVKSLSSMVLVPTDVTIRRDGSLGDLIESMFVSYVND